MQPNLIIWLIIWLIVFNQLMISYIDSYRLLYQCLSSINSISFQSRLYTKSNAKVSNIPKKLKIKEIKVKKINNKTFLNDFDSSNHDMKTLVIVESPTKAKTIQQFLPKNYIVDSTKGHLREFPDKFNIPKNEELERRIIETSSKFNLKCGQLGIDVFNNFEPIFVNMDMKQSVIDKLIAQSKKVDRILLATDEDREGEAISWHVLELLKPSVPVKRAVFHEITPLAIQQAFENPRDLDMDLVRSQETRKILDRLVGFFVSPMLWLYFTSKLSAGRVQSCALNLIVNVS